MPRVKRNSNSLELTLSVVRHSHALRRSLVVGAMSVLLVACSETPETVESAPAVSTKQAESKETQLASEGALSINEQLNQWFEEQYEAQLQFSPMLMTSLGRKDRYGEIDDMSEEAQAASLERRRKSVEEMKAKFDRETLSDDAKLSYDLWEHQYNMSAEGAKFRRSSYVFNQMNGVHTYFPTFMLSFHKVENFEDMQAYVSRLRQLGRAMNQLVARAKLSASEGVRPPRFAYETVLKQARSIISGEPFTKSESDSSLLADVKTKLAVLKDDKLISDEQHAELMQLANAALLESFAPSYENLISFLEKDIANTSEQSQGVHANPNGDDYYKYRLKLMTTTDMTAEEIHQLGLSEVERLRAEMEDIKEKTGFEGSLQEFFAYIRDSQDNEKFYFPNTDEGRQGYIDEATAAIDNIKSELPNYFGILPKGELVVKRVEPYREQDGAPQHYYPGTPDGSRAGIYYAHLSDMTTMPKNELEVIAYHEGLPGHHMQIAIAQELTGVPTFRTQARFTAYSEGWALYSEKLAKEMPNTFTDLHSDFGRLGSEIWRAIRLVVDSGMHSKKWTEQEAIDFFSANSPAPLETIRTEIRRYMVWPGQATSYKVGMIKIQQLRKKAETELGDKFDIKAFHDTVLGGGALPMSMLERKVDGWIASQK